MLMFVQCCRYILKCSCVHVEVWPLLCVRFLAFFQTWREIGIVTACVLSFDHACYFTTSTLFIEALSFHLYLSSQHSKKPLNPQRLNKTVDQLLTRTVATKRSYETSVSTQPTCALRVAGGATIATPTRPAN